MTYRQRCADCGWSLEQGTARGLLCAECSELVHLRNRNELAKLVRRVERRSWSERVDWAWLLAVYLLLWMMVLVYVFGGAR